MLLERSADVLASFVALDVSTTSTVTASPIRVAFWSANSDRPTFPRISCAIADTVHASMAMTYKVVLILLSFLFNRNGYGPFVLDLGFQPFAPSLH